MSDASETERNPPLLEINFDCAPLSVQPDPDLVEQREASRQMLLYRSLRTVVR